MRQRKLCGMILVAASLCGSAAYAGEAEWASDINKAKFAEQAGKYEDAESALQDSVEKARDVVDRRAVVFSNLELGDLYESWHQASKATAFYEQAFDAAKNDKPIERYAVGRAIASCTKANENEPVKKWNEKYKRLISQPDTTPDMSDYLPVMSLALRKKWFPTTRNNKGESTVSFIMSQDGKPGLLHLETSSGDEDADARAITAVANAAPFAALPSGVPQTGLLMHYTFKYTPAPRGTQAPLIQEIPNRPRRHNRQPN